MNISKILSDNGFMNHKNPKTDSYIVENIAIVNFESIIEYIDVHVHSYITYINFVEDNIPKELNFGLSLDMNGYEITDKKYLYKRFNHKNDFLDELHRLNSIGLNIKG